MRTFSLVVFFVGIREALGIGNGAPHVELCTNCKTCSRGRWENVRVKEYPYASC